jgi:abortive infection bacteriophage resistance protein
MANDKSFLTYNQQMKKLRKDKNIDCNGTPHKVSLVRSGYFNMINGYKTPFTCGTDANGNHTYFPNTTLSQINSLKKFDEALRIFLLKYITQVEEEVRTLTGYKFDQCNDNGKIPWYETNAYSSNATLQSKMNTISSAYSELSKSKSEYVQFYMKNHEQIPTWIMRDYPKVCVNLQTE